MMTMNAPVGPPIWTLLPKGIRNFVAKQQPGQRIVGIDKERSGYDVELTNGIDLKFNKAGQFIRYDD